MSEQHTHVTIGTTPLALHGPDVAAGFLQRYILFTQFMQEKSLTADTMYEVYLTIIDVHHSSHWNSGFVLGWSCGLLDAPPPPFVVKRDENRLCLSLS